MENDNYAIITGATSGIGAEFARQLAHKGYNLILSGRRKDKIEKVADEIRNRFKKRVTVVIADFTKKDDLNRFIREIKRTPGVEFLVNNAGFGLAKPFLEENDENLEAMITVHTGATTAITRTVVPHFIENEKGVIINVASMAPMLASPASPLYAATKSFIITFSEALSMLLKPYKIKIQALCPGFVRTDFYKKSGIVEEQYKNAGIIRWMNPEKVVRLSIKSLRKNTVIFIPGFLNKLIIFLVKMVKTIPGGLYYWLSSRSYKKVIKRLLPKAGSR